MQHLVLTKFGKPEDSVVLQDSPAPTPSWGGQVSVRLEAAAINPSDLFLLIRGKYLAHPTPPATIGAEASASSNRSVPAWTPPSSASG